jgi:hypothetical protein
MSLDVMRLWPFRYTLQCQRRNDLDDKRGTLPQFSYYIGSTNNVSNRLCFHFQSDKHGSRFTKQFQPISVEHLCARQPRDTQECLRWEDEMVIEMQFSLMETYTHPEAWRCAAGGSWAKPDNIRMPVPLREKLRKIGRYV